MTGVAGISQAQADFASGSVTVEFTGPKPSFEQLDQLCAGRLRWLKKKKQKDATRLTRKERATPQPAAVDRRCRAGIAGDAAALAGADGARLGLGSIGACRNDSGDRRL